jgi:hypothetical protein
MMMIRLTATKRDTPRSAARKPKIARGTELAMMWSRLACRNGAVKMCHSPLVSCAWMP